MRFVKLSLAGAIGLAGAVLVPAQASASTTFDCSSPQLLYVCVETDNPGSDNTADGAGLTSNQEHPGQSAFCLTPYYSSSGTAVLTGSATRYVSGEPADVRWRVFFGTDPNLTTSTKVFKTEASAVGPVFVSSNPDGGPTTPGYFQGCLNNYEGFLRADFHIQVQQAD